MTSKHVEAREHGTLDAISGAIGAVRKHWGDYGYRVGIAVSNYAGSIIVEVVHSDGSRFNLKSDRFGNVSQWNDSTEEWRTL
jgi:hypothetical protein